MTSRGKASRRGPRVENPRHSSDDPNLMFPLLDTLVAVYEMGQFTVAADKLHVSQSTVSARMRSLEEIVGAPLFERHAKSDVTPTAAGRILYDTALDIGERWRRGHSHAIHASAKRERFSIACSHTTSQVLLPEIMGIAESELGAVDLTVGTANSEDILDKVAMNHVQLGVVEKAVTSAAASRTPIRRDSLVLAGDPHGVWLLREQGSGVRYYTNLFLASSHTVPQRQILMSSNSAIISCLAAGFGQSIISSRLVPDGVPVRDLGPDFVRRFYALTPASGLSPMQSALCDEIIAGLSDPSDRE